MQKQTKLVAFMILALILLPFSVAQADNTLKIGFITDMEYGKQKKLDHKRPKEAKRFLNNAVQHFNTTFLPDLSINGGDNINSAGIKGKEAKKQFRTITSSFKRINGQKQYCVGNHDLRKISKTNILSILGIPEAHSVTDINGFRVITLDTNPMINGRYETLGHVSAEEMIWLEEQLNTSLPVLLFSHQSPAAEPIRVDMTNGAELRATLEKHPNVVAFFSGHNPINMQKEINGINYIIINNLTTNNALGSYATIQANITSANLVTVNITQHGASPVQYIINKQL